MAQRRRRRVVRARFAAGVLVVALLTFLYGYWAPFPYQPTILSAARHNRVSPFLVAAVIRVESRFRTGAVSDRGAVGLMQLLPSSAAWISGKMHQSPPESLTNPRTSIQLGTWYLRYLLNSFHGNRTLALAAYNGGPETVNRWLKTGRLTVNERDASRIPYPETQDFVHRVRRFETAYHIMYAWIAIGKHSRMGVVSLAKLMSEETKMKLGERLGVAEIAREEGWGGVPAKQCGNLVREAIRLAEEELSRS